MDEPPPPPLVCPSNGGGLMALLSAMGARRAAPSALEAPDSTGHIQAPDSTAQVPPVQIGAEDDARIATDHIDPGDEFHTPKKAPIISTYVSNLCHLCYVLFSYCFVMLQAAQFDMRNN
jgi:hypothetical protein